MRQWLKRAIPSMFRRRVILLGVAAAGALVGLATQLARLTLAQGGYWSAQADAALYERRLIPTVRGRILDSRGRVLAEDQPSLDVAVAYPVISGQWAYQQARSATWRAHRGRWQQLDPAQREALIAGQQGAYDAQVEGLWQTLAEVGAISRNELEQRKQAIRQRVEQVASVVWLRRLQRRGLDPDDAAAARESPRPTGEQQAQHALIFDVDDAARLRLEGLIARGREAATAPAGEAAGADLAVWRRVTIERSWKRVYPLEQSAVAVDLSHFPGPLRRAAPAEVHADGVGTQVLGALRPLWADDDVLKTRPFRRPGADGRAEVDLGGYLPGDVLGYWGVERACEAELRGRRGQLVANLESGQQQQSDPQPGGDVVLGLDMALQARVQALMDPALGLMQLQPWHGREMAQAPDLGRPLNGAAVVLDVAASRVLAAVSVPTFSREQLRRDPQSIWGDGANRPFVNRALAMPYEPGSTVKPLVLCAAITDGKLGPAEEIACNGFLDPRSPHVHRCWIYKQSGVGHGRLGPADALTQSCNVFFYTAGRRLGAPRLVWWYRHYGLGARTGCGLDEEDDGDLPDLRRAGGVDAPGFTPDDAVLMGIGQGPIRWTPMQAAAAYAALARGGVWATPELVVSVAGQPRTPRRVDLQLDPRGLEQALRGLDGAVNDARGTGHHLTLLHREPVFDIEDVRVMGKSGTAEAAPLRVDSDGDRRITGADQIVRQGDHGWFIGMVQRPGSPRPDYVVAVVVEYSGSGGAVAGPIAHQILRALRAEGYL